ncbi:MAG: SPASM domain-containing protein [Bacteroidia bacterium]|nr:SPASM domain-containing protein [Bacteroidia bacterium]
MTRGSAFTWKRALHAAGSRLAFLGSHRLGFHGAPLPAAIAVEPTNFCNLRCPECPSGLRSFTRPSGYMGRELFTRIMDEVAPHCGYLTFYFQGEPFLHPEFTELIRIAASRRMYCVTSTNAHFLNEETCEKVCRSGLGKLIVSLDGMHQDTYEKYRIGGDMQRVLDGLKLLSETKKRLGTGPDLTLQFLVMKHNEQEVSAVRKQYRSWGAEELNFKTVQINDPADPNDLMPAHPNRSRYRKGKDKRLEIVNAWKNRCWKLWSSAVITWDGKVLPCCFDKDARYVMGDLRNNTFREIWYSEGYRAFRKQILNGRSSIDICTNCSEGSRIEPEI